MLQYIQDKSSGQLLILVFLESCREVPVVEITAPSTKVGREADPGDVRSKQPPADGVDLTPDVGKVADGTTESEDVDCRSNWTSQGEVQRSPDQVKCKLDAVESGTLLGESYSLRVDGGSAGRPGSVGGVAHCSIQRRPYWAKDITWWMEWRLLEGAVLPLCVAWADGKANSCSAGYRQKYRCGRVGEEKSRQSQGGDV